MKLSLRKIFIVLVLVLQLSWWLGPRFISLHGPIVTERYRHEERIRALLEWSKNPSAVSKAVFEDEKRRLNAYLLQRDVLIFICFFVLDAVGIYSLCNYGREKAVN
jgi:hypothetical protein